MEIQFSAFKCMLMNVVEFLSHHPLPSVDGVSVDMWKDECQTIWDTWSTCLPDSEQTIGKHLLDILLDAQVHLIEETKTSSYSAPSWPLEQRKVLVAHLLERPQVEQRTHEWYMEAANLLTASQIGTIFKGPLTRARLVMDKATANVDTSGRKTVVLTAELNAFTWGIRFEPVVNQIYCHLTNSVVSELGRLKHATEAHLAASPDGLVTEGPPDRYGRFVEFKAPVSRAILNTIPDDYYHQMQLQMEVGNVEECDYLEVKFNSQYNSKAPTHPETPVYTGYITTIGNEEGTPTRYHYSPLNGQDEPILAEGEHVLETTYWTCNQWFLTTVPRSKTWWETTKPAIDAFWADVELARQGKFVVQGTPRKKKDPVCLLVDDHSEVASAPSVEQ